MKHINGNPTETRDMTIEQITFEMTRANNSYDSCVRLGLSESAEGYKADYVSLRDQLDTLKKIERITKTIKAFEEMNAATKDDSAKRHLGHVIHRLEVQVDTLKKIEG